MYEELSPQEIFTQWLRTQGYAHLTLTAYTRCLQCFINFLCSYKNEIITMVHLLNVELSDVRAFLAQRHKEGLQKQSQNVAISAIKTFYRFLIVQGHVIKLSLHTIHHLRTPRRLARPLSTSCIARLIEQKPNNSDWIAWRDYALMLLLYATGMRIQEALNLNAHQWTPTLCIRGKGNKERLLPVLEVARDAVAMYLRLCPYGAREGEALDTKDKRPLFFGQRGKRLQAALFQKKMQKWRSLLLTQHPATPHSLRHSFASHLLEADVHMRDIQEMLGHASLRSTQQYTQTSLNRLRTLYQEAHPQSRQNCKDGSEYVVEPDKSALSKEHELKDVAKS